MARAKRTDRADARRRYRASQVDGPDEIDDLEDDQLPTTSGASTAPAGRGASQPPQVTASRKAGPRPQQRPSQPAPTFAPGQRPSFTASFRAAARPFNIREDIAYIPQLILRTRAVWIPALAAVVAGGLFLLSQPLGSNGLANLLFQLFVLPPTIAGSFLAGILAPRATYIAGGIAALIGALVFSFAVFVTPTNLTTATIPQPTASPAASASAAPSADASAAASASAAPSVSPAPSPSAAPAQPEKPLTDADKVAAALQSLIVSVPFGIAIGAFGGYYKRFLYVSNPSRQRRQLEASRQKSQRGQPPKRRF